jgi:peptidoglycan/xylan/chitin deacetylase (PgdA/CDA1 family)
MTPEQRDAVADQLSSLAGPAPMSELLTADAARRLPRIGFHTVRHDPLPLLDDEQLAVALDDGRTGLATVAGYSVDTIAYPHGRFDSRVVEAARASGFAIGLTLKREPVTPSSDPLALGRYTPPARVTLGEFAFSLVRTLLPNPS